MNRIHINVQSKMTFPAPNEGVDTVAYINCYGKNGFNIKLEIVGSANGNGSDAWNFLESIQQIVNYMASGNHTVQDVDKGLRMISDMEAYFTTWRKHGKLVEMDAK